MNKNLKLSQKKCFLLSTLRNKNLITAKEQERLKKTVAGFFGMSVGSHAALTWIMESRADAVKIIDPDTIEPSNLNRLRFGWDTVGEYKVDVVEKQMLAMHPFVKVIKSVKTDASEVEKIFNDLPKIHIVVDAIDDLAGKILLRKLAKKCRIPLIMDTDVGDNVILDIERYDKDPHPEFFLGRIKDIETVNIAELSGPEKLRLVLKIVGFEHNSEKMLESLLVVGKSLPTWPQLGATATISGGVMASAIKKIILGEDVKSGRYYISLDELLVKNFNSPEEKKKREKYISLLKKQFAVT